jgi:hypothetical protein
MHEQYMTEKMSKLRLEDSISSDEEEDEEEAEFSKPTEVSYVAHQEDPGWHSE